MCSTKSKFGKNSNKSSVSNEGIEKKILNYDEKSEKNVSELSTDFDIKVSDIKISPTYSKPKRAFIIFLICTLVGMWSLGGFINSSSRNLVVNKDGIVITGNEFYSIYASTIESKQMKNATNDEKKRIAYEVLYEMIESKVLEREVESSKLNVSDDDIARIVIENDGFKDSTGQFNKILFAQYLKSQRMSEREFLKKIKLSILTRQIIEPIMLQAVVSPEIVDVFFTALTQEKHCRYIVIDINQLSPADISEDEMRLFFEQNQLMYPEGRSFKFIKLTKNHKKYQEVLKKIKDEFVDISEIEKISEVRANTVDFCSKDGMDKEELDLIPVLKSIKNSQIVQEFLNTLFSYGISEVFTFSTEDAIFIIQNQDIFAEAKIDYDHAKKKIFNLLNLNKKVETGVEKAKIIVEKLKNTSVDKNMQFSYFVAKSPYIHYYNDPIEQKLASMLFETKEPGYFVINNKIVVFELMRTSKGTLPHNMVSVVKNYINNTFVTMTLNAYMAVLMKRLGINIGQNDVNDKLIDMIVANY